MTLRERTFAAVTWTTLSAMLRGLLQMLQLVVLARLLHPAEFGMVAAATAIIAIGSVITDLGLNSAYLHARDVDDEQRSALYWISLIAGALMTLLFIMAHPVLEFLIGDSKIATLLNLYSFVFFVSAVGLQLRYDAEKRLEFRRVAIIEVSAAALGVCVAVASAAVGKGATAIVHGVLAAAVANASLNWLFLAAGWRPRLRVRLSRASTFLSYGLATIGNGLLTQLSTNIDMLIGARMLGVNQFGLYAAPRNLFNQLLSLINPIITRVGFPLIAHLDHDRTRIARLYERMLRAIVGLNAPLYLFAAMFATPLVKLVFGERWAAADGVFAVLALLGLSRSIMNPTGNLLFGMGRPGLALIWNLVQMCIAVPLMFLAAGHGMVYFAVTMLLLIAGQLLPAWYILIYPLCGMSLHEYLRAIFKPLASALMVVGLAKMMSDYMASEMLQLTLGAIIAGPLYIAISWLTREEWIMVILDHIKGEKFIKDSGSNAILS